MASPTKEIINAQVWHGQYEPNPDVAKASREDQLTGGPPGTNSTPKDSGMRTACTNINVQERRPHWRTWAKMNSSGRCVEGAETTKQKIPKLGPNSQIPTGYTRKWTN
ncbi:hypothetical protein R1flu_020512 [Riccia fluitans]|uniref:Uncharacterized protein n=1 Tax=Riccia fluitans TaxID=41844 RepID=A0ABD1ZQG7_9MARC